MKSYKIAVIAGDGTGPEVVHEGVKVLDAVAGKCGFKCEKTTFDFGGARYLRTKEILPDLAIADLSVRSCSGWVCSSFRAAAASPRLFCYVR